MATKTEIARLALIRLGSTELISDVYTDATEVARAVRAVWSLERDYILRAFSWPFATAYAEAQLVNGEDGDPAGALDWTYAYQYPTDCLYFRRLANGAGRRATAPIPYRIGRGFTGESDGALGRIIYSNHPEDDLWLEYTMSFAPTDPEDTDEEDELIGQFDPVFVSCLAWRVAAAIALGVSRMKDMAEMCLRAYVAEFNTAVALAANEEQREKPAESEVIRAMHGTADGSRGEPWVSYPSGLQS